jgi:long-chain-fatty-acid---luciferin-component ligase
VKIDFKPLKELEILDDLIYQCEDIFSWDQERTDLIQFTLISEAFNYHYANCNSYREYCDKFKINPSIIKTIKDLGRIPLIPSALFKEHNILSCQLEQIVKVCQSSGTKGTISKVYRDGDTLNRFLGSLQSSLDQLYCIDDAFSINLGPSSEEAGDLWFSYAMSVVDMVFPTENFIVDGVFYPEKAVERISQIVKDNNYENLVITGAPVMFIELLSYMNEHNIMIDNSEKIFFVTAGGWKRFSGQAISRADLWQMLLDRFLNADFKNFRDTFNMVELNTILPECECQVKHVVPWVKVLIIDPATGLPVEEGDSGLVAFLDPSAKSYPCFVLTDDIGRISVNGKCKCGRMGQGLEIIRRVKSVESRGCALKMDKNYAKS